MSIYSRRDPTTQSSMDSFRRLPPTTSCVSMTRQMPKRMTPRQQYRLLRKGDQAIMEKMPSISMAIRITNTMPHWMVKSVGVKIAQRVRATTIAELKGGSTHCHHCGHDHNLTATLVGHNCAHVADGIGLTERKQEQKDHVNRVLAAHGAAENHDFSDDHDAKAHPHQPLVLHLKLQEWSAVVRQEAHAGCDQKLQAQDHVHFHDECLSCLSFQAIVQMAQRVFFVGVWRPHNHCCLVGLRLGLGMASCFSLPLRLTFNRLLSLHRHPSINFSLGRIIVVGVLVVGVTHLRVLVVGVTHLRVLVVGVLVVDKLVVGVGVLIWVSIAIVRVDVNGRVGTIGIHNLVISAIFTVIHFYVLAHLYNFTIKLYICINCIYSQAHKQKNNQYY